MLSFALVNMFTYTNLDIFALIVLLKVFLKSRTKSATVLLLAILALKAMLV